MSATYCIFLVTKRYRHDDTSEVVCAYTNKEDADKHVHNLEQLRDRNNNLVEVINIAKNEYHMVHRQRANDTVEHQKQWKHGLTTAVNLALRDVLTVTERFLTTRPEHFERYYVDNTIYSAEPCVLMS